ncbi:lipopolysaccharide heptosyltransferase II [Desulfosarcina sp. OttesenSCG-928-A07]|nr:lipopolysaccharide heptosyltransferase II [Desulfosarcina sp. OttesenSCG-928-G17]MDL2328561.1 lipopolysaccharide heptosyltransferase II [Desulfosarcina sp. OttesenSCG-928-A07]
MENLLLKPQTIRRLLIRSTNWIGDAVMTTPAVRAIRKNFPNAHITILAKPWVAPVFEHSPDVDDILIFDAAGRHKGVFGILRLAGDLRRCRFDATILLQNAIEAALITFMAKIPIRIGFDTDARRFLLTHPVHRTPAIKAVHQTGYYLEILKGAGRFGGSPELSLTILPEERKRAREILVQEGWKGRGPLIGINPSATFGPAKQWFPERYAALADQLHAALNATIVIFGGPSDKELGCRVSGMMTSPAIDLSGKTTLRDAMAVIDLCRLFVTNDSGLMHVAAALGTPQVAIFGSTNSTTTSPFSQNSRIVRVPMACSPCMKPVCPLGHMDCMKAVSVDQVMAAAADLL